MNITAKQVQKSCSGSSMIQSELKALFLTFKSQILDASKNGSTFVNIPVPTNFNIINMDNKEAQTIIYNKLIEELEENGFKVGIYMNDSSVIYKITWSIVSDNNEYSIMRNNIASKIIKQPNEDNQ